MNETNPQNPITLGGAGLRREPFTARILIVDDEPVNIKVVRKYLQIAGYQNFITTSDSPEAMKLVRTERPDVILLDVMMPNVSGLDILGEIRADECLTHLPVLILTASTDAQTKQTALALGATDFLAKPVDPAELVPRIRNALLVKAHHDHLAQYSQQLEQEVRARTAEVEASRLQIMHCLARAAEYRDDDTGRHVVRVGRYAGIIARDLGFSDERAHILEMAAQLHDVGKIGIPDAILLKPGKLDANEFAVMKRHSEYGRAIIQPDGPPARQPGDRVTLLDLAAEIAGSHHERWDGNGYPNKLAAEEIPLEGRIVTVADVFDALSSRRPYKEPFPLEKCLTILREGRSTQFDANIVDAFFRRLGEITSVQQHLADAA
jgi:putative two-component system response regulator